MFEKIIEKAKSITEKLALEKIDFQEINAEVEELISLSQILPADKKAQLNLNNSNSEITVLANAIKKLLKVLKKCTNQLTVEEDQKFINDACNRIEYFYCIEKNFSFDQEEKLFNDDNLESSSENELKENNKLPVTQVSQLLSKSNNNEKKGFFSGIFAFFDNKKTNQPDIKALITSINEIKKIVKETKANIADLFSELQQGNGHFTIAQLEIYIVKITMSFQIYNKHTEHFITGDEAFYVMLEKFSMSHLKMAVNYAKELIEIGISNTEQAISRRYLALADLLIKNAKLVYDATKGICIVGEIDTAYGKDSFENIIANLEVEYQNYAGKRKVEKVDETQPIKLDNKLNINKPLILPKAIQVKIEIDIEQNNVAVHHEPVENKADLLQSNQSSQTLSEPQSNSKIVKPIDSKNFHLSGPVSFKRASVYLGPEQVIAFCDTVEKFFANQDVCKAITLAQPYYENLLEIEKLIPFDEIELLNKVNQIKNKYVDLKFKADDLKENQRKLAEDLEELNSMLQRSNLQTSNCLLAKMS